MDYSVDDVLNFWFGEEVRERWFTKDTAFDQLIAERYINLVDYTAAEVEQKGTAPWEGDPRGDLASIIVLDQFPRNIFRDSPRAFAHDDKALALTRRALQRESDMALPEGQRPFVYMPLMHAEDMEAQDMSISVFEKRLEEDSNLLFAIEHRNIIMRFGRFPHRNQFLGRDSTDEEIKYLEAGGFSG